MSSLIEFSRLTGMIYESAVEPEMWPTVLERAATFLGAEAVFLGHLPHDFLWRGRAYSHGIEPQHVDALMQDSVIGVSAYARACATLPQGAMVEFARHLAEEAAGDDPAVQVLLSPQGLLQGHFGAVKKLNKVTTIFGSFTSSRSRSTARSKARLRALMGPLRRAATLQLKYLQLDEQREMLAFALRRLPIGVMIVTLELRIAFLNDEAARILENADGLRELAGQLVVSDSSQMRDLQRAVARAAIRGGKHHEPHLHVRRPSGLPHYALCVGPNSAAGGARLHNGAATVFVTDPTSVDVVPAPECLAARYGLTATEAEVARLAALGRGMPFVAAALGVSINTVRTHLKAVYGKTGVNHQAALIRLLAQSFPLVQDCAP